MPVPAIAANLVPSAEEATDDPKKIIALVTQEVPALVEVQTNGDP